VKLNNKEKTHHKKKEKRSKRIGLSFKRCLPLAGST